MGKSIAYSVFFTKKCGKLTSAFICVLLESRSSEQYVINDALSWILLVRLHNNIARITIRMDLKAVIFVRHDLDQTVVIEL